MYIVHACTLYVHVTNIHVHIHVHVHVYCTHVHVHVPLSTVVLWGWSWYNIKLCILPFRHVCTLIFVQIPYFGAVSLIRPSSASKSGSKLCMPATTCQKDMCIIHTCVYNYIHRCHSFTLYTSTMYIHVFTYYNVHDTSTCTCTMYMYIHVKYYTCTVIKFME